MTGHRDRVARVVHDQAQQIGTTNTGAAVGIVTVGTFLTASAFDE